MPRLSTYLYYGLWHDYNIHNDQALVPNFGVGYGSSKITQGQPDNYKITPMLI